MLIFLEKFQINMKNAVVFTHNLLAENFAKTAHGLLRGTDRFNIIAVIDSLHYGKDAGEVLDGKKLIYQFINLLLSLLMLQK